MTDYCEKNCRCGQCACTPASNCGGKASACGCGDNCRCGADCGCGK